MWIENNKPAAFPLDDITELKVEIADTDIKFKKLELQNVSDDVQSSDSPTPVQLEYAVYELQSP
jgi:hypothetical protein